MPPLPTRAGGFNRDHVDAVAQPDAARDPRAVPGARTTGFRTTHVFAPAATPHSRSVRGVQGVQAWQAGDGSIGAVASITLRIAGTAGNIARVPGPRRSLNEYGGMWDCTRCLQCLEVCPKNVAPMDRIMALRDKAIKSGFTNTYGARHAEVFTDSVKHSGWLDELRLPLKTFGYTNFKEIIKLIPLGIKSEIVGKRPPIFHKSIPGVENVRRIFEKVENKK